MADHTWQRTKIVCTLGPATDTLGVLRLMITAGMDVARINMSHGDHADHTRRIRQVREAARQLERPVAILADLPGPKFRVGSLQDGAYRLVEGSHVSLVETPHDSNRLPVRHPELLDALRPGETVFLADGSIELRVLSVAVDRVDCEVVIGGTLRSGSGINVPESRLSALVPTPDDRRHLAFAVAEGVDWIGVSFVQTADDLARVRACISGSHQPLLMAKIETRRALGDLDSIIASADAVMVARGDLGVETDLAEIPLVQKRIIAAANASARPVVTATQMLESMVEHEHPTRAEVTDIANAVLDGTDAVMLSAESAVGKNPVAAVHMLRRVLTATEAEYAASMAQSRLAHSGAVSADEAVGFAACQLAQQLEARAIIIHARSLAPAAAIARFRPQATVIVLTDSESLCRSLALVWGVSPLHVSSGLEFQARIAGAAQWLYAHALARSGDRTVVLSESTDDGNVVDTLRWCAYRRRACRQGGFDFRNAERLFQLDFLVQYMLASLGIELADLHFLRHGLLVLGRGVEVAGARSGLQLDFFASAFSHDSAP